MRSVFIRAAALVAVAALAAGCGGTSSTTGGGGQPTPSSSAGSPTSTPKPSTTKGPSSSSSTPEAPHATEFNPPGDIPDDAVFVDHVAPGSRVHFSVPEGWARTASHGIVTFTDKYNSIGIEVRRRPNAPTTATARREDVPELKSTVPSFVAGAITDVTRQHGPAVHITYLLDSPPNPVTDKVVRDVAERFLFWHDGEEAILTLTGPEHADNVDPWQIVSDSLQWK